jgi:hypothetical protein
MEANRGNQNEGTKMQQLQTLNVGIWQELAARALAAIDSMPNCMGVHMDTPHGEVYFDREACIALLA